MQELVGRLTVLDPVASETLKIVAYFDALVAARVGASALLRGAAALSGVVAGYELGQRVTRVGPDGLRLHDIGGTRRPVRPTHFGSVWLERKSGSQAIDTMVLERLSLALELLEHRSAERDALGVALDASATLDDRRLALTRLNLSPAAHVRVIALASSEDAITDSKMVHTPYGTFRAVLDRGWLALEPNLVVGTGITVRADELPDSWDTAVIAIRLARQRNRAVDATELGSLLLLARAVGPARPPRDVVAIAQLSANDRATLNSLVMAVSIRAAAAELGVHHSTLQKRYEGLMQELGFDPRTALGRTRCVAAELLLALTDR